MRMNHWEYNHFRKSPLVLTVPGQPIDRCPDGGRDRNRNPGVRPWNRFLGEKNHEMAAKY